MHQDWLVGSYQGLPVILESMLRTTAQSYGKSFSSQALADYYYLLSPAHEDHLIYLVILLASVHAICTETHTLHTGHILAVAHHTVRHISIESW